MSPDPKPLHQDIAENIFLLLRAAVGNRFKVAQRTNLRFPSSNSMPSPDVFVLAGTHWKAAREADEYPNGSDVLLVVEVVSPANRSRKLREKTDIYRRNLVEAWTVYPKRREVKVHRLGIELQLFADDEGMLELPPELGSVSIPVADVFAL